MINQKEMMMNNINTLLGKLELISEEASNTTFLHGQFRDMPFSIQVSTPIDLKKLILISF